jgi:phage regulator Rha-like protein
MRNGLMPKLQPDAAIAGKKHQSIRRLDNHILKITTQTNRAFKRQFIQRFPNMFACVALQRAAPATRYQQMPLCPVE